MNQEKPKTVTQVFYNGRWVDKEFFRVFVYNSTEQKLAESYKEYESLIATGIWFDSKDLANEHKKIKLEEAPQGNLSETEVIDIKKIKARTPKNGSNS